MGGLFTVSWARATLPILKSIELLNNKGFDGFYSLEWLKRFDLTLEDPGIAFVQYITYMRNIKS